LSTPESPQSAPGLPPKRPPLRFVRGRLMQCRSFQIVKEREALEILAFWIGEGKWNIWVLFGVVAVKSSFWRRSHRRDRGFGGGFGLGLDGRCLGCQWTGRL